MSGRIVSRFGLLGVRGFRHMWDWDRVIGSLFPPGCGAGIRGQRFGVELSLYFGNLGFLAERETEMEYTAVIKRSGEWRLGWVKEVAHADP